MRHNLEEFCFRKIKADLVLSLGSDCLVAHHLRKNHLRLFAGPLDWMLGTSLSIALELFKTDFRDFFTHCFVMKEEFNTRRTLKVKDSKTGLISLHHFFPNEDLSIQSKRINAQSVKRWELIKEKLRDCKNSVLIFNAKASQEELKVFLENFCALNFVSDAGGTVLICVSKDESLKISELRVQESKISQNKEIFEYFINEGDEFWGNEMFWSKLMKSIKMPLKIKLKNAFNEVKIRFLRSCKKRIAFFTKKYKNDINEAN